MVREWHMRNEKNRTKLPSQIGPGLLANVIVRVQGRHSGQGDRDLEWLYVFKF